MRGFATLLGIVVSLAATATEAVASEARSGKSGLAVGIFLGFCALIVVAQLLPALRTRLLARLKQQTPESVPVKAGGDR